MGKFDIDRMRKQVSEIQRENENKSKRGLSTLLQFYKGMQVKLILNDGEIINGVLTRYSLYEIEVKNTENTIVVWKQNIKYMVVK